MRRFAAAAAAFAVCMAALGAPVRSQESVPDAKTIWDKVHAANGERAESYREIDEIAYSNGTSTVEHDYVRGKDYRYVYDSGPIHTEEGLLGSEDWSMNANGQVTVDDPDDLSDQKDETPAAKEVVTRVTTPVDGYLVAAFDKQGRGLKQYVDATTWQVVRREAITREGSIVRTYDDIRADHGRTFAHHIRSDDKVGKLNWDLKIASYEPGQVTDAELAIPTPRRRLVDFPGATEEVEIPAKFTGNQVYVRVTINGRGLDFTLDTGASGITIDAAVAGELGLKQFGKRSAKSAGRYQLTDAVIPQVNVGPLVMRDVAVEVIPHGWDEAPGVKDVGLLGFDFLAELGVTIDYEHHRVIAVPGSAFRPPADPHTIPLDVHIGNGVPRVAVSVNGVATKHFILDTGAGGSFIITDAFRRRHPEAFKDQTMVGDPQLFMGIGGLFAARAYKMHSLRLANVNLADWLGYQITTSAYDSEPLDGLIGTEFLRLFTVSLDYGNSRVYLVPNKDGRYAMGIK